MEKRQELKGSKEEKKDSPTEASQIQGPSRRAPYEGCFKCFHQDQCITDSSLGRFSTKLELKLHLKFHHEIYNNEKTLKDMVASYEKIILGESEAPTKSRKSVFCCDEDPCNGLEPRKWFKTQKLFYKHIRGCHKSLKSKKETGKAQTPEKSETPEIQDVDKSVRKKTKDENCKCDSCGTEFQTLEQLNSHSKEHHKFKKRKNIPGVIPVTPEKRSKPTPEKKNIECDLCNRPFQLEADLKEHMETHSLIEPSTSAHVETDSKSKKKKSSPDKRSGSSPHTPEGNYICESCTFRFQNPASLRRHIKIHSLSDPVPWVLNRIPSPSPKKLYQEAQAQEKSAKKGLKFDFFEVGSSPKDETPDQQTPKKKKKYFQTGFVRLRHSNTGNVCEPRGNGFVRSAFNLGIMSSSTSIAIEEKITRMT